MRELRHGSGPEYAAQQDKARRWFHSRYERLPGLHGRGARSYLPSTAAVRFGSRSAERSWAPFLAAIGRQEPKYLESWNLHDALARRG